jgi:hypothetical protein
MEQSPSWHPIVPKVIKKFSAFYGTIKFIPVFTAVYYLLLSAAT